MITKRFKNASPADKANMAVITVYAFHTLWPHVKIYDFGPAWESWGGPFASQVMEGLKHEIVIPTGIATAIMFFPNPRIMNFGPISLHKC